MPGEVTSDQTAANMLKGKKWTVSRTGTLLPFTNDKKSYSWLDEMETPNEFLGKSLAEMSPIQFTFVNDTLANVTGVPETPLQQTYIVTIDENVDLSVPILKLSFDGPSPLEGEGNMRMTYSYPIYGIDESKMILGTPRSVNERTIVVLMEAK